VVFSLSGCSAIKSYFPDKEKEYQLTTEIPELIIPSDLSGYETQSSSVIPSYPNIIEQQQPVEDNAVDTDQEKPVVHVELVEFSGGAPRIRIEEPLERTWRIVGKALSRKVIEITNRNEAESFYTVQYDADFKNVEDGTLWDEVLFIFGKDPSNEQEFKIRLAENGMLTEIIVLDSKDQPQSKGNGFKLLNLLYKTIKADLNSTTE